MEKHNSVADGAITTACRRAFDNIYHKVRAETTFDHFRYICTSFLEQLQRLAPADPPGDNFGSAAHWKEKAQDWAAECERMKKQELGMIPPPLMVFDPKDGDRDVYPSEARQYREWHGRVAWLYNPFTGDARTPEDIGTDPFGLLIVAPAKAPAEGHHV